MKLSEFIKKNNIRISDKYYELSLEGLKIMKNAVDANHGENHIYSLLSELHLFINKQQDVKDLDFEVLLPAICWHDVWKSKREQTFNLITMICEQIFEGYGSRKIFSNQTKDPYNVDKSSKISKLILLHPGYEFLPGIRRVIIASYKPVELIVLRDIDKLCSMDATRVREYADRFIRENDTDPRLFRLAYFWVSRMTLKSSGNDFNFQHTQNRFEEKKKEILSAIWEIVNELLEKRDYYFDLSKKNASFLIDFEIPQEMKLQFEPYLSG